MMVAASRRMAGLVVAVGLMALGCLAATGVQSQVLADAAPVVPGERLSNWLIRNGGPQADTTALHWQVWAERAPQAHLRQAVVQSLQTSPAIRLPGPAREHLSSWLRALPLTGRLTVANADARWLQAAPGQDPVLKEGHQVIRAPRPATVTVVTETALPCVAGHVPGARIGDYLQACLGDGEAGRVDRVWVVQADGRTTHHGVAPWSLEAPIEPGLGAVLWAPRREAGIPFAVSDNLARFLATQLPGQLAADYRASGVAQVRRGAEAVARDAQLTASDWGEIGLLQTPTARMAPAGAIRFQLSQVWPYRHGTVMFQPLDWLETGFRYSDIANRLYDPRLSPDQSRKDKSIDVKIRLREESHLWPQVALGVRDLGGTGLFSGEYLVANKRWGNWDASLGLGWGYLGARGNLRNPLSALSPGFDQRGPLANANGGSVNFQSMFRGPTALFGGVQWHSPDDAWVLKAELDGNSYQNEPLANNQAATSPLNFGAVYRYSPHVDFSLGFERGTRMMVGLTLHGRLNELGSPKLLDPALPALLPEGASAGAPLTPADTERRIELFTGWSVRSLSHDMGSTVLVAEVDAALYLQARIERAVRLLHRDAPASSTRFVLRLQERGLALSEVQINRAEWLSTQTETVAPALRLPAQQAWPADAALAAEGARKRASGLTMGWGPSYRQILGGPDAFLLYQLGLQADAEYRFSDSTWISGNFNLRLLDNYQNFTYTAPSNLPRVRTLQREYTTAARLTMPLLQINHVRDLGGGHFASVYGGMLEAMYGGVGAEWLYRPWQGRLAWGLDWNYVAQRDFQQGFTFRDYRVATGHASMYWDTGWNDVQVKLSAGRYLAGDVGATLDVKRVFSNGVALGAWATKTDVSADQFGEGSFDKGIYVTLPFDAILPKSTAGGGSIVWTPLTRDGGARLGRDLALYELTRLRDKRALSWREYTPASRGSADNTSLVLQEPEPGLFGNLGATTRHVGQQLAEVPGSTWLWAGGAVLLSSLLDKPADAWAQNNQGENWRRVGSASSAVPYALALGTGLLFTGIAGEGAQDTATTAIKAAAYTLGANAVTRLAVGRARPSQELGNTSFSGFNRDALDSGFASNHVALAFALATPFAQQYRQPWLYALAGASAIGRVQERDHWLSDTVAGAFMGYAFGSFLSNPQQSDTAMRLSVTPNSVTAQWPLK